MDDMKRLSWPGASPKWLSTVMKKGWRGRRIPASNDSTYTQTEPGGGGDQEEKPPVRIGAKPSGMEYFLQIFSRAPWLRSREMTRSGSAGRRRRRLRRWRWCGELGRGRVR
ncbi:hypothetical protein ZWY2020_050365 [Hordeum vulgare]|nr:hypothetical protein ZWY2020_050365 [Hordeum vulgare]